MTYTAFLFLAFRDDLKITKLKRFEKIGSNG